MASTETWVDFESVRHAIKANTVDKLKQILSGFNEECGTHFSKSGKKQDIIDRIWSALDSWRAGNSMDKWTKAKNVITQVRMTGQYTSSRNPPPLSAGLPLSASSHNSIYDPPKVNQHYASNHAGPSSIAHYDPYAPPRRPSGVSVPAPPSSNSKTQGIRFKDSPFFNVDQSVSNLMECPESTSPTDRRQQILSFSLTPDQATKMRSGSRYQLRLFCTSSIFYAGVGSFRTSTVPCPVEFPPTCEVRVNNTQITANLKGLKKKPGTAPPPDISKYSRTQGSNKVEMVYVNSQQPVQTKKFYMVVMLVQATTVDDLVSNLRGQHLRTSLEVRQKMIQNMSQDDDIIAGPQKMSLKCPLTFVRISTPCRSSKCVHPQCFDATSWFTMMEQTTTWLCPVCERVLDHKDLIMDGYFEEILRSTPESVEDVIVEADGQWHTSDNKYGSADWLAVHPPGKPSSPSKKTAPPQENPVCPAPVTNGADGANGKGKDPNIEIFVLDSDDDDDEGQVKRELSPSYTSSASRSFSATLPGMSQPQGALPSRTNTVIDLTLDSDDEEPAPSHAPSSKRTATEAELDPSTHPDQSWKKTRVDPSSRILPVPHSHSGSLQPQGVPPGLHTAPVGDHPSPPSARYASSFTGNNLPRPVYPAYDARAGPNNPPGLTLPPINNPYNARQARWPS
ncbi:PINIT domain-containing protein [Gymnopilus junonius]|uniref:PINIT domain-containing protein n=1 Tax=Gymnopilus junonius TaxID=109634 RepID=A0A9P5NVG4_GYMJU|nr:PINIT domain-containing protein [Gymnopilus junonius]